MNLVDQIFAQAQLGTAQDPNANPFATGVQLGQNQQRINLARQEMSARLGQMALEQTVQEQNRQMNALKMEDYLTGRQRELENTAALTSLSKQIEPLVSSGNIDQALRVFTVTGMSNGFLATDPRFKAMSGQLETMLKESNLLKYRQQLHEASEYRSKPTYEKFELDAKEAEARGDYEMASSLRAQASLERDKLELAKQRIEIGQKNLELRESELKQRLDSQRQRMPADRKALMDAKIEAVQKDIKLLNNRAEKIRLLEEIAKEFEQTAPAGVAAPPVRKKIGSFMVTPK